MKKKIQLQCMAMLNPSDKQIDEGIVIAHDRDNCNDVVFVQQAAYAKLFDRKAAIPKNYWKGRIVKISYGSHKIHRRIETDSSKGLTSNMVLMSFNSIGTLSHIDPATNKISKPLGEMVEISKGCRFMYWWTHPNPAARISYHLGILSVLLAVVSIMLSLFL